MYGVAIGGGYWEGSPSRSLRPEVAAAAKSEGRRPFWVACHSRNTHSLGTNSFLGWHKWWGVPLGSTVYWVWTESQRWCVLLAMSFWWLSSPYTEGMSCQSHDYSQGPSICATQSSSPQRSWSSPLLLPSSICHHKAEGNQVCCRFGPARKAADWSKQVNSPKLKCLYKMSNYLWPRISGLTLPIIRWDTYYQIGYNKNIPRDC